MNHEVILQALRDVARTDKAESLPRYFQVCAGGYGEGDQFIGCVVPDQRVISLRYRQTPLVELKRLLNSPWHECRSTALFILVLQFEQAMRAKVDRERSGRDLLDFYLANLARVNNWDLVDASAPKILGEWLLERSSERTILIDLAKSETMWERRVAVVATMPLIHAGECQEILQLAKMLILDKHDLMHKAIGWMLREVWKQDPDMLRPFLEKNIHAMPRTTVRYAIERISEPERLAWLKR